MNLRLVFEKLTVNNFGPVGHVELNFERGLHSVVGRNLDNFQSDSNGSGKSTIFAEAIVWVIRGKGNKDILKAGIVHEDFGKNCFVILEGRGVYLNNSEFRFKISRYINHSEHGSTVKFEVDGKDFSKRKDTQDVITKTLCIPDYAFSSLYVLQQGLRNSFSMLKPQGRKEFIEDVRPSKIWDTAGNRALKKLKAFEKELMDLSILKTSNLSKVDTLMNSIAQCNLSIQSLELEKTSGANPEEQLLKLEHLHQTLYNDYEITNNALSDLESKYFQITKVVDQLGQSFTDISSQNNEIVNELNKTKRQLGLEICPSCNQKIKGREVHNKHIKNEIEALEKKLQPLVLLLEEKELELSTKRSQQLNLSSEISSLTYKRNELTGKIQKVVLDKTSVSSKLSAIDSNINLQRENKTSYEEIVKDCEENLKELEDRIQTLEISKRYAKECVKIFSFKGIRAYLLSKDLEQINAYLHEYSSRYFSDQIIKLEPKKSEDGSISRIDINSIVLSSGKVRTEGQLSGGEKRRVDVMVQIALRKLMEAVSGLTVNILVIDEIFHNLDKPAIQATLDIFQDTSTTDTCCYVISHTNYNYPGHTYSVTKQNNNSKLSILS